MSRLNWELEQSMSGACPRSVVELARQLSHQKTIRLIQVHLPNNLTASTVWLKADLFSWPACSPLPFLNVSGHRNKQVGIRSPTRKVVLLILRTRCLLLLCENTTPSWMAACWSTNVVLVERYNDGVRHTCMQKAASPKYRAGRQHGFAVVSFGKDERAQARPKNIMRPGRINISTFYRCALSTSPFQAGHIPQCAWTCPHATLVCIQCIISWSSKTLMKFNA